MKTILLDTNFLITSYKYGIDIFGEIGRIIPEIHEIAIPSGVIEELGAIQKKGSGSDKLASGVALELIEKKGVRVIESEGSRENVDEFMINFAINAINNRNKIVVCTNDKELKERLKKLGIRIICTRGKNRLEIY